MVPTIKTGSKVWLNKIKLGSYKRGDIIGFEHNRENFVKRIVGMPQDYLIWEGKDYFCSRDTFMPSLPPIREYDPPPPPDENFNRTIYKIPKFKDSVVINEYNFDFYKPLIENCEHIPAGKILNKIYINNKEANSYVFKQNYYFVEGDNKAVSVDSRTFGLIGENQIIGKKL